MLHDGTAMAATSEGDVHIVAIRLDSKPDDALLEQRRNVINSVFHLIKPLLQGGVFTHFFRDFKGTTNI